MVVTVPLHGGEQRQQHLVFLLFVCLFETGPVYVDQACLKLLILLAQQPESWNYRHALPYLAVCLLVWSPSFILSP